MAGLTVASRPAGALPSLVDSPRCESSESHSTSAGEVSVCCNQLALRNFLPGTSAPLAQTVCQLLTFPTASRSEAEAFQSQILPDSLLSHSMVSSEAMTLPSLWWNRDSIPERLGGHRLVDSWAAYTTKASALQVVDIALSPQFWRALTLSERYGVLTQFGTSAQAYGYQLRFFHSNGYTARLLGLYACELPPPLTQVNTSAAFGHQRCVASVDGARLAQMQQALWAEAEHNHQTANISIEARTAVETPTAPQQSEFRVSPGPM